ncbi:MAG: 3-deoxy-8-phosphooctulonate synthase [Planctomycetes bacterium]|nr:3-deoxy-8-phosphooctulonate synthase [Planctomycetota bacterium]
MAPKTIRIAGKGLRGRFLVIAGPCVIEGRDMALRLAEKLKKGLARLDVFLVFKASYDKANRSSIKSYRGVGLDEGLRILEDVKKKVGLPVLTDVHSPEEAAVAGKVIDLLQVPAFLCRQTDLVVAAAEAGKAVNLKKAQFLAPWDMANVVEKAAKAGAKNILVTERGTSFGYNNLVSDMRSIPIMRRFGYPVIYDATHSVQLPGGLGSASGGQREMAVPLARAAVAAGCDGLFLETHERPEKALSDAASMLPLRAVRELVQDALSIRRALRKR